jgi:hypothetical protein
MPLTTCNKPAREHSEQNAAGFWMKSGPTQFVRILVTYEALWELDPKKVRDAYSALETLDKQREMIETVASAKYDTKDVDKLGSIEGQPVLTLKSMDF